MQPTLITEIAVRLDRPDPGRCTECKLPTKRSERPKRRRQGRRR
jgi:hypothetical protein